MSEAVVDCLETIEIQQEQRDAWRPRRERRDRPIDVLGEMQSIRETGQRIAVSETEQAKLSFFASGGDPANLGLGCHTGLGNLEPIPGCDFADGNVFLHGGDTSMGAPCFGRSLRARPPLPESRGSTRSTPVLDGWAIAMISRRLHPMT
jgi:hypothetical protein